MRTPKMLGLLAVMVMVLGATPALASHNPAEITYDGGGCVATTFDAAIADAAAGHKVSNMYLVVHADGVTQYVNVPTDGSSVSITVGPFGSDTTVMWHVFGGGERAYDDPLWNGYGTPSFSSDINDYYNEVGTFSWVIAGPDDPNPFVTWHSFVAEGCSPEAKSDCKKGGWESFGFRNQGQCVRFVQTGKDSR